MAVVRRQLPSGARKLVTGGAQGYHPEVRRFMGLTPTSLRCC